MLKKTEILNKLRVNKTELHKFGVIRIGLFGSVKREETNEESDVDILIDFNPELETYDNYIKTCSFLEHIFAGSKLDIVTKQGLSPFIGPYILKDVEYA